MFQWGGTNIGALPKKCPRVVKLVMRLHHVNQGGNQGVTNGSS